MKSSLLILTLLGLFVPALADDAPKKPESPTERPAYTAPKDSTTNGSVTIGGHAISYQAVAGTLMITPKSPEDLDTVQEVKDQPEANMSYTAYFKSGADASKRPIMFLYNGGPGSASVWLHMGAFGPVRVVNADDKHIKPAPYSIVNNEYSLLDVADLVFIDAPATGFGRIMGKGKEKAFLGVDADAETFAHFINEFLTHYGRWNSPKYLLGESYGTTRSAGVAYILQTRYSVDLNGVVLLSQILDFAINADGPEADPGNILPYELALPSYAAIAWYHNVLPNKPEKLEPFLSEVEQFAEGDYAHALSLGNALPAAEKHRIAARLHDYTGLSIAYLEKANIRVNGGEFSQTLQVETGQTTGRLDARFSGPAVDVLDKQAEYDPLSSAIGSAYVSAYNDYARKTLKFGEGQPFREFADVGRSWDFRHKGPGNDFAGPTNLLPDLSITMKFNPHLKVLNLGGYFDLATPFYAAGYELRHLQIPPELQGNVESIQYPSGHMIYTHLPSLKKLHEDLVNFVGRTDNLAN